MRLSAVRAVLEKAPLAGGRLGIEKRPDGYTFANLKSFKQLVASLEPIPQFQQTITALEGSRLYSTAQDGILVNDYEGSEISKLANSLYAGAVALLEMLRVALPEERPESVVIKLPDSDNLKEIAEALVKIEQAISQVVVNPTIEGEVRVETWEQGSFWILIYLKTLAAVDLVGRLARAAALLAQTRAHWKLVSAEVEGLKIKNSALQELVNAQRKLLKDLVDNESRAIEDACFPSHENEQQERLKETIRGLSELIFKGAEIHPSLTAPPESKELFPKYEPLPASTTKQLEDKAADALRQNGEDGGSSTPPQNGEA